MKTLQKSLLNIFSENPIVAEGILDASEIDTTVDDAVANMQTDIIKYYTDYYRDKTRKIEIKGDKMLINSNSPVELAGSFHAPENIDIVKHIVCNNTYEFKAYKAQCLESITAPTIIIHNTNSQHIQLPQMNADNFIILYYAGHDKNVIANYNLNCKGTIKIMAENNATWGDDVTLENNTFNCKKLILISYQNFNGSFRPNPWLVTDITKLGLTKSSKIKQIDCINSKEATKYTKMIRYTPKAPKNLDKEMKSSFPEIYPINYPTGWYCDKTCKVTKATFKL